MKREKVAIRVSQSIDREGEGEGERERDIIIIIPLRASVPCSPSLNTKARNRYTAQMVIFALVDSFDTYLTSKTPN